MNRVEAKLSCGHSVRLHVLSKNAKVGETTYCRFDGYVSIEKVFRKEWRVICCDCQYGRWDGQSESFAQRTAYLHRRNKKTHRPFIVYDEINTRGGTDRKKLVLDYLTAIRKASSLAKAGPDEPPF